MLKFLNLLLFLSISLYICKDSPKLEGTPICSDGNDSKTLKNAFTDDYTEEFKAKDASNGWVGLELSAPHKITKIGWAQKSEDKSNYMLGVFEGANDPDFFDAYPLYMITSKGKIGEMNYVDIDMNYSFQYVRYVGPNNKTSVISGLEFYGYEAPTKLEKDEEEKLFQPTNLPLVIVHTKNGVHPQDKVTDVSCIVTIIDGGKRDTHATGAIRLRGNATMRAAKKPYKMRFDSKKQLLDFPSTAKKWNLLANYNDRTLVRTAVAMKLSELFKMKYTPNCKFVDLIFNGEYLGNYGLCDKVEMKKGRMELDEMDKNCTEEPEITGGYMIEAAGYSKQNAIYGVSTKGVTYSYRYPETDEITEVQRKYIDNFFNKIESEAYEGIVDRIDKASFLPYILVQELSSNADALWSNYMYKEREDDTLYFGPLWDFDNSFGDDSRTLPIENFTNFIFKYSLSAGTMVQFVTKIFSNEEMIQSLKDYWNTIYESDIVETILKFIDDQTGEIKDSAKLNFIRWDILMRKKGAGTRCTYEREVEYLKDYIAKRFDQLDGIIKKASVDFVNEQVKKPGRGGGGRQPGGQGGRQPGGQGGRQPGGQGGRQPGGQGGRQPGGLGEIDESCLQYIEKD